LLINKANVIKNTLGLSYLGLNFAQFIKKTRIIFNPCFLLKRLRKKS